MEVKCKILASDIQYIKVGIGVTRNDCTNNNAIRVRLNINSVPAFSVLENRKMKVWCPRYMNANCFVCTFRFRDYKKRRKDTFLEHLYFLKHF